MYWFTSDEHYGHTNIIKYCNRPYRNVAEMDEDLIRCFNSVVNKMDVTVHAGDFAWSSKEEHVHKYYVSALNGSHIFLKGSHDRWLKQASYLFERKIGDLYVVVCHYCLKTWPRSYQGSICLFGHSHGRLPPETNQWDITVDNNNYFPISLDQIHDIMKMQTRLNEYDKI